jgi:hypothetical protein
MALASIPESCTQCPYIDQFHSNCSHPLRQSIIQEVEQKEEEMDCPVFQEIRADIMADLEADLDEIS